MHLHDTPAPLPKLHEIGPDLLKTSPIKRFWILIRPILFSVAYLIVAYTWNPFIALPLLLCLFISVMAASHDVVHNCLHLGKRTTHLLLSIYGILVMQSGHGFRITHLSHHAMYPSKDDPEGAASFGSIWQALLMGPLCVPRLWLWAMARARKQPAERRWMILEAILAGSIYLGSILLIPFTLVPIVYVVVMTLGAWFYPLITDYFPHHPEGHAPVHQARSIHGRILPWLLLGLNYHLEHHLYPRVPGHHLHKLSRRLLPYLKAHEADVIQVP
jgi:beta-carotene hydroxylase